MSTTAAARLFDSTFHTQARTLETSLSAIPTLLTQQEQSKSLNSCLEDIANLQRSVQDAASYSNNHDQAVYASTLKKLHASAETVRNSITPKSKFKFKVARQAMKAPVAKVEEAEGTSTGTEDPAPTIQAQDVGVPGGILGNGASTIADAHITVSSDRLGELSAKSIQHISTSIVDLATHEQKPSASLGITDITSSILCCGNVDGPVHMTSIKSSLIFAKAHQLRIHDCEDVTLFLDVGSQPVIERCQTMRFAPLGGEARQFWNQVLDFQFPGGDSPNWAPIPEDDRSKGQKLAKEIATPEDQDQPRTIADLRRLLEVGGVSSLPTFTNSEYRLAAKTI